MSTCSINWNKLVVLVLGIGGVIALASQGVVNGDAAVGIIGAGFGYVFGNGHALVEKKTA